MIKFLRGKKSNLEKSTTVYAEGQPICESDTGQLKIGDGTSTYTNLKYVGQSSGGAAIRAPKLIYDYQSSSGSSIDLSSDYNYILVVVKQKWLPSPTALVTYNHRFSYLIPLINFDGGSSDTFKIPQYYSNGSATNDINMGCYVNHSSTGSWSIYICFMNSCYPLEYGMLKIYAL